METEPESYEYYFVEHTYTNSNILQKYYKNRLKIKLVMRLYVFTSKYNNGSLVSAEQTYATLKLMQIWLLLISYFLYLFIYF